MLRWWHEVQRRGSTVAVLEYMFRLHAEGQTGRSSDVPATGADRTASPIRVHREHGILAPP